LIADYSILIILIAVFVVLALKGLDTPNAAIVLSAWIANCAIASGCYYWKSKSENLIKMPILLLVDLPDDMREKADPNQIIASVLGIGTN
jgi:hypothetical protein